MLNIIGIGFNRDELTIGAFNAINDSDVIIASNDVISLIEDLISSKEVIEILPNKILENCEIAIRKSKHQIVSIICLGDSNIYGINNALFTIIPNFKELEVKIYPGISSINRASSLLGSPLDDFAVINLTNDLISFSEIENKLRNVLTSNLVLCIYNPISKNNKYAFNIFKELVLDIRDENDFIGIVDTTVNILRVKNLTIDKVTENSTLILGNKLTYKKNGKLITSSNYPIKKDIHELSYNHYKKLLNNEIVNGSNKSCEYYPCHYNGQFCDFCYCPFYPCGDSSTGGYWIKDKDIWSCENCLWIHNENTVNCILNPLKKLLDDENDLNNKKQSLLKLRRNCILGIK